MSCSVQVKIRGYRIEISEVESSLAQLPQVASVCVVAMQLGEAAAKTLVAYVVPKHTLCETNTEERGHRDAETQKEEVGRLDARMLRQGERRLIADTVFVAEGVPSIKPIQCPVVSALVVDMSTSVSFLPDQ